MKEKKYTIINPVDIVKKALEAKGLKVELYSKEKFDPKKKGDFYTLGFLKRFFKEGEFSYGEIEDNSVMAVEGDSINIFDYKKETDIVLVTMFSHVEIDPEKPLIDKFTGVLGIIQNDLYYKRKKDGLKFDLIGPRQVQSSGFIGWYDFILAPRYYIEKDVQEIIDKEIEALKQDPVIKEELKRRKQKRDKEDSK